MSEAMIQRASASEVSALGRLSDIVFRPGISPGEAMSVEFGPMFNEANADHLYFVAQEGVPVSLVGTVPARVHIGGAVVRVVSMGSVCTLAEYRKHRYASQMVERVIADFTPTTSVLLVSGGLSIYRRVGCVDFGNWWSATVDTSAVPVLPHHLVIREGGLDAQTAKRLYNQEALRFSRTAAEMASLLSTLKAPQFRAQPKPARVFTAHRAGEVCAYAVAVAGPDKLVHLLEWAGDRNAVLPLAEAAAKAFAATHTHLYVASGDQTLRGVLSTDAVKWTSDVNQGTLRVLNPDLLLEDMGLWIEESFGASLRLPSVGQETWRVDWQVGKGVDTLPDQGLILHGFGQLSTWLFGAQGLQLPFARTDDLNYV